MATGAGSYHTGTAWCPSDFSEEMRWLRAYIDQPWGMVTAHIHQKSLSSPQMHGLQRKLCKLVLKREGMTGEAGKVSCSCVWRLGYMPPMLLQFDCDL